MTALQRIQAALAGTHLLALGSQVRMGGALLLLQNLVGQIGLQVGLLGKIRRRCPG